MDYYKVSLEEFKRMVRKNRNITKEEWDAYAQQNGLYSALTLQIRGNLSSFKKLKDNCTWFWIF